MKCITKGDFTKQVFCDDAYYIHICISTFFKQHKANVSWRTQCELVPQNNVIVCRNEAIWEFCYVKLCNVQKQSASKMIMPFLI